MPLFAPDFYLRKKKGQRADFTRKWLISVFGLFQISLYDTHMHVRFRLVGVMYLP